ncbi:hypothetical protein [Kiloniella sp. EL199]|uniref:hypothetical protein n=1 Tax=Kiloniella sp. EL199 TaxID=2107581 RepID=UPI000EA2DE5C|nr:hypothetical protein [Kiloniella sp. EL199]
MIKIFQGFLHFIIFVVFTVVTQIGGIAYLLSLFFRRYIARNCKLKFGYSFLLFIIFYGFLWGSSIFIAPQFGRVALPCFSDQPDKILVQSPLYCMLNRQYVSPKLLHVGNALATDMNTRFPGTYTLALDANFPFFDGFPLLPHLSHDDGKKLDIAFYYRDNKNMYAAGETKSPIGYWGFEQPTGSHSQLCSNSNQNWDFRWDMDWFQMLNKQHYQLDPKRTSTALRWLTTEGRSYGVSKVFIEPYLTKRLGVSNEIIRFQGCKAARHDDHIHIQITK